MADYVPESHEGFDDTYAGDELAEAEFEQELESFKAEQAKKDSLGDTSAFPEVEGDLQKDSSESIVNNRSCHVIGRTTTTGVAGRTPDG